MYYSLWRYLITSQTADSLEINFYMFMRMQCNIIKPALSSQLRIMTVGYTVTELELNEADIPGASLSEPLEVHSWNGVFSAICVS